MEDLINEQILENIYQEVLDEYFPEYDEEQCEAIAKQRFEESAQWLHQLGNTST